MSVQIGAGVIIVFVLLMLLVLFLIALSVHLNKSVRSLERKYKKFMKGLNGASLEQEFFKEFRQLEDFSDRQKKIMLRIKELEKRQEKNFSKYGIVKYDAFEDVGGKLSFVLALLGENDTGLVLNAIHSKDNCFLYLKEIVKGESYIMLSDEEVSALLIAKNFSKTGLEAETDTSPADLKPDISKGTNNDLEMIKAGDTYIEKQLVSEAKGENII